MLNMIPLPDNSPLAIAGQQANQAAARATFTDYRKRKAPNTTRRQDADLHLFADFLTEAGVTVRDLNTDPAQWRGITWGLVQAFIQWQLTQGYAVDSVNVRLSTVKQYAKLATQAGALDPREYALIKSLAGYSHKEKPNIDGGREAQGIETRRTIKARTTRQDGQAVKTSKKSAPIFLSKEQRDAITASDGTPQGIRDALLMTLMLEHGLRVGEVELLQAENFNTAAGTFTFYRPKTKTTQAHRLTDRSAAAYRAYQPHAPKTGSLWRASAPKNAGKEQRGQLTGQGLKASRIYKRVELIGRRAGIEGLSPHDLRHTWAERAKGGTATKDLQTAGGWNSPAMPLRYQNSGTIANDGVTLED